MEEVWFRSNFGFAVFITALAILGASFRFFLFVYRLIVTCARKISSRSDTRNAK